MIQPHDEGLSAAIKEKVADGKTQSAVDPEVAKRAHVVAKTVYYDG